MARFFSSLLERYQMKWRLEMTNHFYLSGVDGCEGCGPPWVIKALSAAGLEAEAQKASTQRDFLFASRKKD